MPANIAEAVGRGDAPDVLRRLGLGEDPRLVLPVRPDVISSSVAQASALEAAVWSRRVELIGLLDRWGAFDDASRLRMGCLARDLHIDDIASYLGAGDTCVAGEAMDMVLARTTALRVPAEP